MGLAARRIFLDSCIAIYLVEEHSIYAPKIETLIGSLPDAELCVSDLTMMECLVGPFRTQNQPLEDKFKNWFGQITVFPVTGVIFSDAARLRADHPSLKTPDALHIATAIRCNCDEFWTNDESIAKAGFGHC